MLTLLFASGVMQIEHLWMMLFKIYTFPVLWLVWWLLFYGMMRSTRGT